jgi:hypothetical protein
LFLDRRPQVTGIYLEVEDVTEFSLPYDVATADRADFRVVKGAGFTGSVGALALLDPEDFTWVNAHTVRIDGNLAGACYVGFRFASRYTFSAQYMRNAQDVPITGGSLVSVATRRSMLRWIASSKQRCATTSTLGPNRKLALGSPGLSEDPHALIFAQSLVQHGDTAVDLPNGVIELSERFVRLRGALLLLLDLHFLFSISSCGVDNSTSETDD